MRLDPAYAQILVSQDDKSATPTRKVGSQPASAIVPSGKPQRGVNLKNGLGIYPELLRFDPAKKLNLGWYYNWTWDKMPRIPETIEFVPMVFGWYGDKDGKTSKTIASLRKTTGARYLLGYNEPDGSDQAALTPAKGLDAWPVLMRSGLPLGSPAGTHAENDWMKTFMKGASDRRYRVDFMTVHWYYLPDPDSFLGYLEKIYRLYSKSLWITEFANVDWDKPSGVTGKFTSKDVVEFLRVVIPRLNKLDYVHRYAWFTTGGAPYGTSSLFTEKGALTDVGEAYAAY